MVPIFGCLALRAIRLIKTVSYAVLLFSQHFWFLAVSFDAAKKTISILSQFHLFLISKRREKQV